jgi:hypothetical protein
MLLKVEEAVGVEGMRSDHEKLIEMQVSQLVLRFVRFVDIYTGYLPGICL